MAYENNVMLDDTDWEILHELQRDARITYKQLGQIVKLSAPAVADRIHKLEDAGIITGYRAEIDRKKVGFPILAYIRLSAPKERSARVGHYICEIPEIIECSRVAGSDSFVMKVGVVSMEHLEHLIDHLSQYGTSITSIELSSVVSQRIITKPENIIK